ncbi:MAG: efflux RND transporter periplasmic adaptor subunit [Holosporales bacterium]|jgi:HlyD family secretion protein|nr:efflux RND transporter periplasmic adaptor subunit [Holosporales bacterium]
MVLYSKRNIVISIVTICFVLFVTYIIFFKDSEEIVLNGNVEIQSTDISFRVSGRICKIFVDEGMYVKKGDVLAKLDDDVFIAKVKCAEASINESEVNLKNAIKNYKRAKELLDKNSISEKIYDTYKAEYEIAHAKINSAKASYECVVIDVADTELKSPIDGVILTRNVEFGEMINAGVPAFSVMPHSNVKVKTFAGGKILSRIKYGDKVFVSTDAIQKKFNGHIGFISSEAEFTPRNIETKDLRTSLMYRIRVIIDEPAEELKCGMPVTVSYHK